MVMLKVLAQEYEATRQPEILTVMERYFAYQLKHLPHRPLSDWGRYRAAENICMVFWLYDRTGEEWLLDLARLLFDQSYDWTAFFDRFPYQKPIGAYLDWKEVQAAALPVGQRDLAYPDYMPSHIVNVAMAVKYPALKYRLTGDPRELEVLKHGLEQLYRFHGVANGMFIGDEHLNGNSPSGGTELCAVVELMYSLEEVLQVTGAPHYRELLEKVAFNALPATIDKAFCSHQYLQQANQVLCSVEPRSWYNNAEDSNIFGFAPNFGCCTANMHQGWPKLASHLWMRTPGGLAAPVLAPSTVDTNLGGSLVRVVETTNYPFEDQIAFTVYCSPAARFTLSLPLPGWCGGYELMLNGAPVELHPSPEGWLPLERLWEDGDRIELRLNQPVRLSHWANGSVAVESGPLCYALDLGAQRRRLGCDSYFGDFEVYPQRAWNYALLPETAKKRQPEMAGMAEENLYADAGKLAHIEVDGIVLKDWKLSCGSAALPPDSPVPVPPGLQTEKLRLVPYGATTLRITQFPWCGR